MKKLLSVLLAVLMAATLAVGLTACDDTPAEHTHEFATAWTSDETNHWHACTGENCTEVKDKAAHTWDDGEITTPATETADGIKTFTCTVCGKTKTENVEYIPAEHTHEFATAWSSDENYHWHACTEVNCTEVKDKAAHTWNDGEITTPATETADGIKTFTCTVCGKTKTESVEYVPTVPETITGTFYMVLTSETGWKPYPEQAFIFSDDGTCDANGAATYSIENGVITIAADTMTIYAVIDGKIMWLYQNKEDTSDTANTIQMLYNGTEINPDDLAKIVSIFGDGIVGSAKNK